MKKISSSYNRLHQNMRYSKLDAFFFALMAGSGEGYFVAFALEAGLPSLLAGLLGTIPLFVGGTLQLLVPYWLEKKNFYHQFIYKGSMLQAFSFLPLAICAFGKYGNFSLFLLIISLYWVLAFSIGPAWNVLMSGLIPSEHRNQFFSQRSLLTYSGMFLGVIGSGILLEYARKHQISLNFFGLIFIFCFFVRMISAFYLKKHSNIPQDQLPDGSWSIEKMRQLLSKGETRKIIFFIVLFKIPIFISAPFFVPFMLKELHMDYVAFMAVLSASVLGKILISKKLSWFASKISLKRLLFFSCMGICIIPVAWLLGTHTLYFLLLEIMSGIVWGTFEYSFFLIILNEVPRKDQARFMSVFNFLNALAILCGSFLGGLIFANFSLKGYAYIAVFASSSILRTISLSAFPHFLEKIPVIKRSFITRPMSVRPTEGAIDRPVLPSTQVIHK